MRAASQEGWWAAIVLAMLGGLVATAPPLTIPRSKPPAAPKQVSAPTGDVGRAPAFGWEDPLSAAKWHYEERRKQEKERAEEQGASTSAAHREAGTPDAKSEGQTKSSLSPTAPKLPDLADLGGAGSDTLFIIGHTMDDSPTDEGY